jgi:hypothetical protein
MHILSLRSFIQRIRPGPRLHVIFRHKLIFYGEELLAPRPTPPSWLTAPCRLSATTYSIYYIPYLEAVSSIRNLGMRPAVLTRDPPNVEINAGIYFLYNRAEPLIKL